MIIQSVQSVLQPEVLEALAVSGLIVLTHQDKVCGAIVRLSDVPTIQGNALRQLQSILDDQYASNGVPQVVTLPPAQEVSKHKAIGTSVVQGTPWLIEIAKRDDAVAAVIRKQTTEVQRLLEAVLSVLMDSEVNVKSTLTSGGDLRFYFTRVNFAEIRFQAKSLLLRLRTGKGKVNHNDFQYCNGNDGALDIGVVRLMANQRVPELIQTWIDKAKEFTKTRN